MPPLRGSQVWAPCQCRGALQLSISSPWSAAAVPSLRGAWGANMLNQCFCEGRFLEGDPK